MQMFHVSGPHRSCAVAGWRLRVVPPDFSPGRGALIQAVFNVRHLQTAAPRVVSPHQRFAGIITLVVLDPMVTPVPPFGRTPQVHLRLPALWLGLHQSDSPQAGCAAHTTQVCRG
jgi:hypothetical protein